MSIIIGSDSQTAALAAEAAATASAAAFIERWQGVTASELSTSHSFFSELCRLLGVEVPHPTPEQDYMFERPITFVHGDGSTSPGRVDCYRRGHFVWESKKLKAGIQPGGVTTKAFDDAMLRARQQAEDYARALPASEGRPPLLVVADVGHVIELYAEFTRSGATYAPYPDPGNHRIHLARLVEPDIRARLRALWTDPLSLDPARVSAKVTRKVADELAELAKSLEAAGHAPQKVAAFLTRCLFSMFAEDVGLLPRIGPEKVGSFAHLLKTYGEQPATLAQMLKALWVGMNAGGFNAAIAGDVLRFNGKIFKGVDEDDYVLPLTRPQIDGLLRAAGSNWKEVEPAIFGTLLERALDTDERHALGAHYTPRAYVERLVLPTVVEPLRADWANAKAAALLLARQAEELGATPPVAKGGKTHATFDRKQEMADRRAVAEHEKLVRAKWREAQLEIRRFHHQLCTTRVLDPACGSGNFLYVTLEHLKRLEGEVVAQLVAFGDSNESIGDLETVTLKQLLGIELNQRAAALAELVLWIGWLQWQVRTRGLGSVAEPVVHDYGNIECRDAVLAYDRTEPAVDESGKLITRWDGKTFKVHPVTGVKVPEESAQVAQWMYINPRPAEWPQATFIVGNPPFLGKGKVRESLGDGYVVALREAWRDVPDSADFVAYWWHHAAQLTAAGDARSFGLITTNSLRQGFNRRVVSAALRGAKPIHLSFAIADHPWVDSANGAAVRIAMTVGQVGVGEGRCLLVTSESEGDDDDKKITFDETLGLIRADLRVGANVTGASRLRANLRIANTGYILGGRGFVLGNAEKDQLSASPEVGMLIHPLFNGDDIVSRPRGLYVVDCHGMDQEELRRRAPAVWQLLHDRVYPERRINPDPRVRNRWWLFRRTNEQLREATSSLPRFIVTPETAKHRIFTFLDGGSRPEHRLVVTSSPDAMVLGVLSSRVHITWALAAGGTLEDRPVYNKSLCFETFPFPSDDTGLTPGLAQRIRAMGEQLDAHRKARQAAHSSVTLTGLYNVLDKLRLGHVMTTNDKVLHEQGLVSVLKTLHDDLDAMVLQSYGWSDLGPVPWADEAARAAWTEALLERLVALNTRRVAEETAGTVRWLRPDFQDPARRVAASADPAQAEPDQATIEGVPTAEREGAAELEAGAQDAAPATAGVTVQPWPATLPDQVRVVAALLAASPSPLSLTRIQESFKGRGPWRRSLPRILDTLEAVGRARQTESGWRG